MSIWRHCKRIGSDHLSSFRNEREKKTVCCRIFFAHCDSFMNMERELQNKWCELKKWSSVWYGEKETSLCEHVIYDLNYADFCRFKSDHAVTQIAIHRNSKHLYNSRIYSNWMRCEHVRVVNIINSNNYLSFVSFSYVLFQISILNMIY